MMCELIRAGADVFRFNFSHGTEDDHAENVKMAREAAKECGKEIGILGDLPGPKLRLGDLEGGVVQLDEGDRGHDHDRGRRRRRVHAAGVVGRAAESGAGRRRRLPRGRAHPPERHREGTTTTFGAGSRSAVPSRRTRDSTSRAPRSRFPRRAATTSRGSTSRSSRRSTCSPSRSSAAPRTSSPSSGASAPAARTSRCSPRSRSRRPPSAPRRSSRRRRPGSWSPAATSGSSCRSLRCRASSGA